MMEKKKMRVLAVTAYEKEEHGEEDEEEVEEFGLEVLLVEDHGSEEEADDD